jgi:hypothetical protein
MGETARAADAVSKAGTPFVPTHLQDVEWLRPPRRRDAFRLTRPARFGSVPTILPR